VFNENVCVVKVQTLFCVAKFCKYL